MVVLLGRKEGFETLNQSVHLPLYKAHLQLHDTFKQLVNLLFIYGTFIICFILMIIFNIKTIGFIESITVHFNFNFI